MKPRSVILLAGGMLLATTAHVHALEAIGSIVISSMLSIGAGGALTAASAASIGLTAIGYAVTAASLALSFFAGGSRPKSNPQDIKNTTKGSEGPGRHAFGRVRLGGETGFGNTAGYSIYRLLLHCFGKIVAVEEWFYDGRSITVEDNGDVSSPPWATQGGSNLNVRWKAGDGSETAWPDLVSSFSSWTTNHRVRGIGQTLLRAINPGTADKRFARLFQGGIKPLEAVARVGEFYDPRSATSAWTMNGVLICLHYFRRLPGMRDDLIDFTDVGAVATQADMLVPTLDGTAPRCRLSGGWKGPLTSDVVRDMLESAGLEVRTTGQGKFTFRFIEDDPASEMTFALHHVLETYPQAGPEGVQRPNICRLRYFAPQRGYEVAEIDLTDAAWARVQSEIDKYGEQEMVIELVFCPDPSQAQRIARRLFYMARADFGVAQMNFAGTTTRGLKTITIEVPDIGENGGSAFIKVRKGTARVNDSEGTVEVPFQIIPDELKTAWNPATMEVDGPPALPVAEYQSSLDTPVPPWDAVTVQYPSLIYETRIRCSGVTGGTIAEMTRRQYSSGSPQPWQSMAEYLGDDNWWYGIAAVNYSGVNADFRVRFFDDDEEGSYWSPQLQKRPVTIVNTPCAAPTVVSFVPQASGEGSTFVVRSSELHCAYVVFEEDRGLGWVVRSTQDIRPGENRSFQYEWIVPTGVGQHVDYRATVYTSNHTIGTPATEFIDVPPTGP